MANNSVITFEQLKKTAECIKVELNKKANVVHDTHVVFPNLDEYTSLNFGDTGVVGMSPKCARSDHTHTLPPLPISLPNPHKLTISLDGAPAVEYNGSEQKEINISCASINASEQGHQHKYLTNTATNTISSTSNDTVANWGGYYTSVHWFNAENSLINQPSTYGYLLNIGEATEVHQLWTCQPNGDIYHRGGNSAGWSGTWRMILDDENYESCMATNEEISTMLLEIYESTSVGTGNITTNATREDIDNLINQLFK